MTRKGFGPVAQIYPRHHTKDDVDESEDAGGDENVLYKFNKK